MDYERKFKDMAIEDLRQLDIRESIEPKTKLRKHDLEVVRAFVDRVEKRFMGTPIGYGLHKAMQDELAAMEAEVKDGD